jgi:hypothetical protein
MSRLILTNKATSEMNHIPPFSEIELSDEELFGEMLVTVTLQDGSKQYGLFTNLAFPMMPRRNQTCQYAASIELLRSEV